MMNMRVCVSLQVEIRVSICDLRDSPLSCLVQRLFLTPLQTPARTPNSLEDKYLINIQLHLHRKQKLRELEIFSSSSASDQPHSFSGWCPLNRHKFLFCFHERLNSTKFN